MAQDGRDIAQSLITLYHTLIGAFPEAKVKGLCGLENMGGPGPLFQAV